MPILDLSSPASEAIRPVFAATELQPFGQQVLVIPPGQNSASFTSELLSTQSFFAVQAVWNNSGAKDSARLLVRTRDGDWHELYQDPDAATGIFAPAMIGPATTLQVKVELSASDSRPEVSGLRLALVDPGESTKYLVPQAGADEVVIARKQWGADESLRLVSTRAQIRASNGKPATDPDDNPPVPTTKPEVTTPTKPAGDEAEYGANCSVLQAKYPDELKVSNVIRTNSVGEAYTWPIAYTPKLRKLVVHHTDMAIKDYDQNGVVDSLDYQAGVRAIYYFHTITRDWGDIGYNYLIDPDGTIYEGRAGGDLAIGAHSLCKNNGSLGIALLGTFTENLPTQAALMSLQSLLEAKGKEYNIDLQGSSVFLGSLIPNVVGHKDVRATNCPGDALYALLPQLRTGTLTTSTKITFPSSTQIVNSASSAVSKPLPVSTIPETKKVYKSSPFLTTQSVPATPGGMVTLNIQFRNQGNTTWNSDTMLRPTFVPPGVTLIKQTKQSEEMVAPDNIATFLPQLLIDKSLAKSNIVMDFYVVPDGSVDLSMYKSQVKIIVAEVSPTADISLNGANLKKNLVAAQLLRSTDSLSHFLMEDIGGDPVDFDEVITSDMRRMRVKLSMPETYSVAEVNQNFAVVVDNVKQYDGIKGERVTVTTEPSGLVIQVGTTMLRGKVVRVDPVDENGIVTLVNFNHAPAWNPKLNDNEYRGSMEWRVLNSKLVTINDLPLEDYLKGLAEVSNSSPYEKQKLMAIIARSYGLYYLTKDQKFPGLPYNLDDNPDVSQKYLGYGYEKRSPAFVQAVKETAGLVVTYDGEVVKTPYFNKSDGRTRSAEEVWGWTHTPYLVSVPDPLCQNPEGKLAGHGVGLSGCGAEEAAKRGYSAEHIIGYYYPGTKVEKR